MNAFQKTAVTTLIATLLLVGVGSMVRVAGAGLGCPDWPRCWGCWWPPRSIDDVDPAYLKARGLKREDFNPVKMWIEYANRMVGVTIGLLVLATFARSIPYRRTQPVVFYGALLSLALVIFSGWLGGQVVRSGLKPGMITLHMVAAMALLIALLYTIFKAATPTLAALPDGRRLTRIAGAVCAIVCVQMVLGTQVREAIDPYIKDAGGVSRSAWIENVGVIDHVHRSFTWLVLAAAIYLVRALRKHRVRGLLYRLGVATLALLVAQAVIGIVLAYTGLPKAGQVLHLFVAALLLCTSYGLYLCLTRTVAST